VGTGTPNRSCTTEESKPRAGRRIQRGRLQRSCGKARSGLAFGRSGGLAGFRTDGRSDLAALNGTRTSPDGFVNRRSINPVLAGGPLVLVYAEVVGINPFIFNAGGGNEGLGFAIPSAIVAFAYSCNCAAMATCIEGTRVCHVQDYSRSSAGLKLPA